jgi:predicted metal-binding membrane protein
VVAAAWVALWAWGASGSAYLLSHDRLGTVGLAAAPRLMAGWILMTVAMMLPAGMPLVAWFHKVAGSRARPGGMAPVLAAGYLAPWVVFGAAIHVGDWALHQAAVRVPWVAGGAWSIGPIVLIVAGLYQFTALKQRCLTRCCAVPRMTPAQWASADRPASTAFGLGVHEGAWSIGCCWALMLLMLAGGMSSLAHMVALGAVMAVEKNVDRGHPLSTPLGAALLLAGLVTLALGALSA